MVKNIFTLREPKDRSGILYMATFVGQHGFPWMVISGIYASGLYAVPKEYMLASTIASAFYALDITFRVTRVCEAQGVAKSSIIARCLPSSIILEASQVARISARRQSARKP